MDTSVNDENTTYPHNQFNWFGLDPELENFETGCRREAELFADFPQQPNLNQNLLFFQFTFKRPSACKSYVLDFDLLLPALFSFQMHYFSNNLDYELRLFGVVLSFSFFTNDLEGCLTNSLHLIF